MKKYILKILFLGLALFIVLLLQIFLQMEHLLMIVLQGRLGFVMLIWFMLVIFVQLVIVVVKLGL